MVTNTTSELIESYITLNIWFLIHQDNKEVSAEQFALVFTEIGRLEDELRKAGVSDKAIQGLGDFASRQVKTPISELSENSQLRMMKIIYGGGAEWSTDPLPPKQSLERGGEDAENM